MKCFLLSAYIVYIFEWSPLPHFLLSMLNGKMDIIQYTGMNSSIHVNAMDKVWNSKKADKETKITKILHYHVDYIVRVSSLYRAHLR